MGGARRGAGQTWVPPAAVTAQVRVQPLQWNIGRVRIDAVRRQSERQRIAQALRYAPRWYTTTPFGSPVVPDV